MIYKSYNRYNNYKNYKGYKSLPFFKQAEIIHDFTVEFCQLFLAGREFVRTREQMVQAARSGKQNIAEGYLQKSIEGRLKLVGVARASLEELLNDYLDFLRQRKLRIWDKDSPQASKVRRLAYNRYKTYKDYKIYLHQGQEPAANAMVCLINQTNRLLDQKLRWLEQRFVKEGGFRESLFRKRMEYRRKR